MTLAFNEPAALPCRPRFRPGPIELVREQALLARIRWQLRGQDNIDAIYAAARRGGYRDCTITRNRVGAWKVVVEYDDKRIPPNLHLPEFMLLLRKGLDDIYRNWLAAAGMQARLDVDERLAVLTGQLLNTWYCLGTESKKA